MKRWLVSFSGCLLCCTLCCVSSVCAQSLSTLFKSSSNTSRYSFSKELQISFPLDSRQSFFLGAEYVRVTSFPDELVDDLSGKQSWKLKGVPITFGYRRFLANPDRPIVPVLQVGASYYFCRMKMIDAPVGPMFSAAALPSSFKDVPDFKKRYGMGYGAEAALGLRADLTRHLFVLAEGQGRFVHGLAFVEGDDLNSRAFTFDFSMGLGVKL